MSASPDRDSGTGKKSGARNAAGWSRNPILTALAGALLTGLVAWAVAHETNESALASLREQIQAEREDRDATRRAEVYEEFAAAANNFAFDAALARSTCGGPSLRDGEMSLECDSQWEEAIRSRIRLQGATNDVYVYGSDDARLAQQAVSATLPPTLLTRVLGEKVDPIIYGPAINYSDFRSAYNDFLAVMCIELPYAEARGDCAEA